MNNETNFATIGASNHSKCKRPANDFYSTDPRAITDLFEQESFDKNIWECACGDGSLSKEIKKNDKIVTSTDLVDRGYGRGGVDFLEQDRNLGCGDIITNPPFSLVTEFIEHGLDLTKRKLAIFARIQLLESKKRYNNIWCDSPLKSVNVYVDRIKCYRNGMKDNTSSAVCYAWFVWDLEYNDEPIIRWIK